MKYIEAKRKEQGNISRVTLYKKGLFLVAFENSAFILSQFCKLKACRRPLSKDQTDIVYVGFPIASKEKFFSSLPKDCRIREDNTFLEIDFLSPFNENDILSWRDSVRPADNKVSERRSATLSSSSLPSALLSGNEKQTLTRLREFDIIKTTPDECQLFLLSLQRSLLNQTNE